MKTMMMMEAMVMIKCLDFEKVKEKNKKLKTKVKLIEAFRFSDRDT